MDGGEAADGRRRPRRRTAALSARPSSAARDELVRGCGWAVALVARRADRRPPRRDGGAVRVGARPPRPGDRRRVAHPRPTSPPRCGGSSPRSPTCPTRRSPACTPSSRATGPPRSCAGSCTPGSRSARTRSAPPPASTSSTASPGPTAPRRGSECALLSRRCHRCKQAGFTYRIDPDGGITWTTPTGRHLPARPLVATPTTADPTGSEREPLTPVTAELTRILLEHTREQNRAADLAGQQRRARHRPAAVRRARLTRRASPRHSAPLARPTSRPPPRWPAHRHARRPGEGRHRHPGRRPA